MPIRPMKGATIEAKTRHMLRFPYLVSPKLDGIRAVIEDGTSYSNSGKALPSKQVQRLSLFLPDGLDGEWVYGNPTVEGCLEKTKSAVMSIDWPVELDPNELRFYVFDYAIGGKFIDRVVEYKDVPDRIWLIKLPQTMVYDEAHLDSFYEEAIRYGYEGLILKNPNGLYKHGRATEKQNLQWKMKPFGKELFEATIIGWYPLMEATIESHSNALGLAERSYSKEDKIAVELLGGWHVRDNKTGVEFSIGGGKGMTLKKRAEFYKLGDDMIGDVIQYTCMQYGEVDKPRHPQYRAYRSRLDMTEY